jgi:hypothetical protein
VSEWNSYAYSRPKYGVLCRFKQMVIDPSQQHEWTGYREDLHPLLNIAYLAWKLTGIAKYHNAE